MRLAFAAILVTLTAHGFSYGQQSPFEVPRPAGGPIFMPDGKIMSGMDVSKPAPWSGALEFGLNGSDGNTNVFKLRTGFDLKYDEVNNFFVLNALYILTSNDDDNLENKAFFLARNELPLDGRWAWYAQGALEYDEFRTIDFRLAAHNGISATMYRDTNTVMKLRGGLGTARVWGDPQNDWIPEAQFGGDVEYALTKRTRFVLAGDYYPDINNFANYRVRVRASFDVLIDPDLNLLLRVGAFDRYDSFPYGSKRNDLDYFMTIVFAF